MEGGSGGVAQERGPGAGVLRAARGGAARGARPGRAPMASSEGEFRFRLGLGRSGGPGVLPRGALVRLEGFAEECGEQVARWEGRLRGEGAAGGPLLEQLGAQREEISAAIGALRTLRRLEGILGTGALSRRISQHAACVSSENVVGLARALRREQDALDGFLARRGERPPDNGARGGAGALLARCFRHWLTTSLGRQWERAAHQMAACHWGVHLTRTSLAKWRAATESAAAERGRRVLEDMSMSGAATSSGAGDSPPWATPPPAAHGVWAGGPIGEKPLRIARVQRSIERVRERTDKGVGGATKNQFALMLEQVSRLSSSLNKFMLGAETQIQYLEGKVDNWQEQTLQYFESSTDSCSLLLMQADMMERQPWRLQGGAQLERVPEGGSRRASEPSHQRDITPESLLSSLVQSTRRTPFVPV